MINELLSQHIREFLIPTVTNSLLKKKLQGLCDLLENSPEKDGVKIVENYFFILKKYIHSEQFSLFNNVEDYLKALKAIKMEVKNLISSTKTEANILKHDRSDALKLAIAKQQNEKIFTLSPEILIGILLFLNKAELMNVALTCKYFFILTHDPLLKNAKLSLLDYSKKKDSFKQKAEEVEKNPLYLKTSANGLLVMRHTKTDLMDVPREASIVSYDSLTLQKIFRFHQKNCISYKVCDLPNSQFAIGTRNSIYIYDHKNRKNSYTINAAYTIKDIVLLSNKEQIVYSFRDRNIIHGWDLVKKAPINFANLPHAPLGLTSLPNNCIGYTNQYNVYIFDMSDTTNPKKIMQIIAPPQVKKSLVFYISKFATFENYISVTLYNNSIQTYNLETQKFLPPIVTTEKDKKIEGIIFLPTGELANFNYKTKLIEIWNVETGKLVSQIESSYTDPQGIEVTKEGYLKLFGLQGKNNFVVETLRFSPLKSKPVNDVNEKEESSDGNRITKFGMR